MTERHTITASYDFECMECHTRLTLEQAEAVISEGDGCPGCGGTDIDIAL